TAAPDTVVLTGKDGDGRANERRVLLTGFAEGNQQLRVNGLFWGLDNWIYGANGRSDGEVRWSNDTDAKEKGAPAEAVSIRRRDFRFRPDYGEGRHVAVPEKSGPPIRQRSRQFEAIAGHSQFGCAHDDWGDRFPVHNLIQRRRLVPNGATFIAERTEAGKDFLASTDPWFHGVFTTTGPDGCLYVVDFYRKYVEHPAWVAEELKNTTPWRTGEAHGRIWRIHPKTWKSRATKPNLSRARSSELLMHLADENGLWPDTAQRLLVER